MKKFVLLTAILAAFLAMFAYGASAQYASFPVTCDKVILVYYGADQTLKGCRVAEPETDGVLTLAAYDGMAEDDFVKVYDMQLNHMRTLGVWQEPTASPSPQPTSTPVPTVTPVPTAEPQPTTEPVPAVYEKKADAVTAFAVVDRAAIEATDNGATQYAVYVWYQGRERILYLPDDMTLSGSSTANIFADGQKPTYLRRGDVITFTTKPSGKIRDISLVCRPPEDDIVTSGKEFGKNFEQLFSHAGVVGKQSASVYQYGGGNTARIQYIFGVVTDKNARSFTLSNKAGRIDEAADISITSDTIVYTYDISSRQLSRGSTGDIVKSEFYDKDDDGNILSWREDEVHHYVLARVIDGMATDVMVYQNYND